METTTWGFSHQFTAEFQSLHSDLETRLQDATSKLGSSSNNHPLQQTIQDLVLDLAKLTKKLDDATGSLPSYDQRQYENRLKVLEKELNALRTSATPQPRFAFKRAPKPVAASPAAPSANSASSLTRPTPGTTESSAATLPGPGSGGGLGSSSVATGAFNLTLDGKKHQYLDVDSLPLASLQSQPIPTGATPSDITISNIEGCIINLLSASKTLHISAVHVNGISDVVLLLPMISGSAMMHNMKNCLIVVGCHQFRMHTSTNITTYLQIPSTPIIEHCSSLTFGMYPLELAVSPEDRNKIKPFSVQDFSYIRPTPSPNWSMMKQRGDEEGGEGEKVEWPLRRIEGGEEVRSVLKRLLGGQSV